MRRQVLDWLARLVTERRRLVLSVVLLLTAALATQIPKLRADPAPESLLSSYKGGKYESIQASFEQWFGARRRAVLLLIEAPDVLAPSALQSIHNLSRHFAEKPWVEHVDSITTLNIPRRVQGAETEEDEDGPTLDELDELAEIDTEGDGEEADELDLDALEESDTMNKGDMEDAMFNALLDIIESDPARFEGGIAVVGPKLSEEVKADVIIKDDTVTEEEAAELSEAIQGASLLKGRLIDEDRTVTAIALSLADLGPREMRTAMDELREDIEEPQFQGVEIHLGGLPYLRSVIVDKMREDNLRLIPLTLLVCVILLTISFRWLPGILLPIAAVAITAIMVVGGMGMFGEDMNILNNIIVPLLIIIGISDAIHLIQRYRDEVSQNPNRIEAGQHTVRAMAVACMLTSATTAVGLASLVVSKTVMLRHFGITSGIGVMISYAVIITFLPAILTWAKSPNQTASRQNDGWFEGLTTKWTKRLLGRPWLVLGLAGVLTGLCGWGASKITVDHALLDQFDETDPVYETTLLIEEKLDGVRPLELVLTSEQPDRFVDPELLESIEKLKRWAALRPEVIRSMSAGDVLKGSLALIADDKTVWREPFKSEKQVKALITMLSQRDPSPISRWLTDDGEKTRVQFKLRDIGAEATMEFIDELEAQVATTLPNDGSIHVAFAGEAYTGSRGQAAVVNDLLGSLLVAVFVIFLLLAFFFRSIRLGLLSIPPNLIPLVVTMAYMVWREIPLNVSTVIIFSISLGLAVNGTIHVLARFREESRRGLDRTTALTAAARGTGRAIVVSCLTLMAGFAVLLVSSFVPVRNFGELIAVTITACLVATLVVLPPLLGVAGGEHSEPEDA